MIRITVLKNDEKSDEESGSKKRWETMRIATLGTMASTQNTVGTIRWKIVFENWPDELRPMEVTKNRLTRSNELDRWQAKEKQKC